MVSKSLQEYIQQKTLAQAVTPILASSQEEIIAIWELIEEGAYSSWLQATQIQDPFCFRAKRRALLTAEYLIDIEGNLDLEKLQRFIVLLEQEGNILYIDGHSDRMILDHILSTCRQLLEQKPLQVILRSFKAPVCHSLAEDVLHGVFVPFRKALKDKILDRELRVAVLSACFVPLRQNVGSCFATAPAILIQREQLGLFIKDLHELLMTGKLKRTFGGVEFSVPLSPTSGIGDLGKTIDLDFLLKGGLPPLGLVFALEEVGCLPAGNFSISDRVSQLQELLERLPSKVGQVRITDLIHSLLLTHLELTSQDLLLHEKMQKSLAKSQGALGSVVGSMGSAKMQACELLERKEKKAKATFKGVTDHSLIKAWEFTLASFAEGKTDFAAWNLYSSLGLDPEEKGGIGEVIFRALQKKLDESNHKTQEYQEQYLVAYDQLRATEALLQRASTESEIRRLKAEHASRLVHLQSCQSLRDEAHEEASNYASFLPFLVKQYQEKFQEYFQEIYDAEMLDVEPSLYEDSPAGFRLVYKHGRSNASLWSLIYTQEQFIDVLVDFFLGVESQIASACEWKGGEKAVEQITTELASHLRTEEFIRSSFLRLKKAHGNIQGLESGEKKPWAYTSGGSMVSLLKIYYRREGEITEESKWVEDETHLLTFILDTCKSLPTVEEAYALQEHAGMLMTSPTHAFILYPFWKNMKRGWQDPLYTYSWIRDEVILPRKQFYERRLLSQEEQFFLLEELKERLPLAITQRIPKRIGFLPEASIGKWREQILSLMPFKGVDERVDGLLMEALPLFPGIEWRKHVVNLLEDLVDEEAVHLQLMQEPDFSVPFLTAKTLQDLAKTVYVLAAKKACLPIDLHQTIAQKARTLGLAAPEPFLFADTNWMGYSFGFIVNPGTLRLELWRLDLVGLQGYPMTTWKGCFDGDKEVHWKIFPRPSEYTSGHSLRPVQP